MNQQLLKNFQEQAKRKSVNELKSITPDRLMNLLKIDKYTVKKFVEYLHNKHVLSYKYNFKCVNCGEDCTAYEIKLKKCIYKCSNCGDEISNEVIVKKSWIIYNVEKEELMNLGTNNEVDLVQGTLKENNFKIGKDNVIELIAKRNDKMKVFIGSSKEAEDEMERVAIMLEDLECDVLTWKDTSVFVAGDFTLDSLINITKEVDAAVFVFNGEDETWYRGESVQSVRDNVLLEYGLFIGNKGRKNVVFMCKNNPKIATDLLGVTYLRSEQGDNSLKRDVRNWINSIK